MLRPLLFLLLATATVGAAPLQVNDFGAQPEAADNTAAFQKALDEAGRRGGERVEIPPGRFRFLGCLQVPSGVSLVGRDGYAPSHPRNLQPASGTTLEVFGGRGRPADPAFVTIGENGTLRGLSIVYPEQSPQSAQPLEYPFCVAMRGNNPSLIDVELLNPYQGIDASKNQRALIRNVHGQPLRLGLFVDEIYDVGRIENVHWNPWWSFETPIYDWQRTHGEGFVFGRTDWHSVLNSFCFGYSVGYRFLQTEAGVCNGSFVGIGADACHTCVQVDQSSPFGLLFSNGQFVAMHGAEPTNVRIGPQHAGLVRFSNCSYWGAPQRAALIEGQGTVSFSDCKFQNWATDMPCIEARGGSVSVRGCELQGDGMHFRLGPRVQRAILTENMLSRELHWENRSRRPGNVVQRDNLGP